MSETRTTSVRFVRSEQGYEAYRDDRFLGVVYPIEMASHIRRGRAQVSPWWMGRLPDGTLATGPDPYRTGRLIDRWQRRTDAAAALDRLAASDPGGEQ